MLNLSSRYLAAFLVFACAALSYAEVIHPDCVNSGGSYACSCPEGYLTAGASSTGQNCNEACANNPTNFDPQGAFSCLLPATPSDPLKPPEDDGGSCLSGDVMVKSLSGGDSSNAEQLVAVRNLKQGDKIQGLDSDKQLVWCTVEAVGLFAESGLLFGNYTRDHFVLASDGSVKEHGEVGERNKGELFNLITSCPVAIDEIGTAFTAVDRFCGTGSSAEMEWSDYLLLHSAMLKLVQDSGPFWFSGSTYNKQGNNKELDVTSTQSGNSFSNSLHNLCFSMLTCAKDENECDAFESAASLFLRDYVREEVQTRTKEFFPALGTTGAPGSVSYSVRSKFESLPAILLYCAAGFLLAASVLGVAWTYHRSQKAPMMKQESPTQPAVVQLDNQKVCSDKLEAV